MNVIYNMSKEEIANKYNLDINNYDDKMIINAMFAIRKLKIENWVRDFNESNGFVFSSHKNIYKLMDELKDDGHSGASAAITLRNCQNLLKLYNKDDKDDKLPFQEIEDVIDIKPPSPHAIVPETYCETNESCCSKSSSKEMKSIKPPNEYICYSGMDDNNKKAMDVWNSQGLEKAIDFMFKHPETGLKMDYATMRHYYG